jgi:5-formyltetrahydrofolate cyclo-ligase
MQQDTSINQQKSDLRKAMLSKRFNVPASTANIASKSIARHYADHPILAFAPSIGLYAPMRGELDVMKLAAQMLPYRKITSLPRIQAPNSALIFHQWQPGDALTRHALGHHEPNETAEIISPKIVLTPLLAFDEAGNRLGYGGGYYDYTMQHLREKDPATLFIGIAFSLQEVAHIPTQKHDCKLDGILTEQGVSLFDR